MSEYCLQGVGAGTDQYVRCNCLLWVVAFPFLVIWLVMSSFGVSGNKEEFNGSWGAGRPMTKLDKAMVILISSDGFRWGYHQKAPMPNIDRLRLNGTEVDAGMIPVYPSVTFPNHYSSVTGLYPAWYGIIGNHFSDPDLNSTEKFDMQNNDPK